MPDWCDSSARPRGRAPAFAAFRSPTDSRPTSDPARLASAPSRWTGRRTWHASTSDRPTRSRSGADASSAASRRDPGSPREGSPAAAQRPYQQLLRDPAGTRHLRAGHDLPGRQAGDAPPRRGPPQHALPRLQQADGPGGGRGSAGHRHERWRSGNTTTPRPWPAAWSRPAATTPASCRARRSAPATSRFTRWPGPIPGGMTPSCGSSTRASPACVRGATRTASCRAGGRRSSRRWPRRTAAI